MPRFIAGSAFVMVTLQGCRQINVVLIGQTRDGKYAIRQFIGQMTHRIERHRIGFLEALLPRRAINDAGYFPHFFNKLGDIGKRAEIPDTDGFNPIIHILLPLDEGESEGHWARKSISLASFYL